MTNDHSFSALDRHAVLSGSDHAFPWYAGDMMASRRMDKSARLAEKIRAAFGAVADWLDGETSFMGAGRV